MSEAVYTVERLTDVEELWPLEALFLEEIGEEPMNPQKKTAIRQAVEAERIIFFLLRRDGHAAGICSVSPCFSTFAAKTCGIFDDFYVTPGYRGQGCARRLTETALDWCRERGYGSVLVGASQGDVSMYKSLGFEAELGVMQACIL